MSGKTGKRGSLVWNTLTDLTGDPKPTMLPFSIVCGTAVLLQTRNCWFLQLVTKLAAPTRLLASNLLLSGSMHVSGLLN